MKQLQEKFIAKRKKLYLAVCSLGVRLLTGSLKKLYGRQCKKLGVDEWLVRVVNVQSMHDLVYR